MEKTESIMVQSSCASGVSTNTPSELQAHSPDL